MLNNTAFETSTTGTGGTIAIGSAVDIPTVIRGFNLPAAVSAVNGKVYGYRAQDGSAWEWGTIEYSSSGPSFVNRTPILSSDGPATAIDLSGNAQIFIVPLSQDFVASNIVVSPTVLGQSNVQAALAAAENLQGPGVFNGKLVVTTASNDATFALKTLAGNDPSAADPVILVDTAGARTVITAAVSTVAPDGAQFGRSTNVPFRVWSALVNDGGTPKIVLRNCSTATEIRGFSSSGVLSASGIGTGSDAALTNYSSAAVSTPRAYAVLGFATWESGINSSTQWNTDPTSTVKFGPGVPLPGEATGNIASVFNGAGSSTTSTSQTAVTGAAVSITPSSTVNFVEIHARGTGQIGAAGSSINSYYNGRLRRDTTELNTPSMAGQIAVVSGSGTNMATFGVFSYSVLDKPFSTSSISYNLTHARVSFSGTPSATTEDVFMVAKEIMG